MILVRHASPCHSVGPSHAVLLFCTETKSEDFIAQCKGAFDQELASAFEDLCTEIVGNPKRNPSAWRLFCRKRAEGEAAAQQAFKQRLSQGQSAGEEKQSEQRREAMVVAEEVREARLALSHTSRSSLQQRRKNARVARALGSSERRQRQRRKCKRQKWTSSCNRTTATLDRPLKLRRGARSSGSSQRNDRRPVKRERKPAVVSRRKGRSGT